MEINFPSASHRIQHRRLPRWHPPFRIDKLQWDINVRYLQEPALPTATVKEMIAASLRASKDGVFLRSEFDCFGDYRQVSRAVKELVADGVLVRVGYGVYARGRKSSLSDRTVPEFTLTLIGLEAMRKLDVGKEARALREGLSTQLPMLPIISVGKSRVRRKIGFGKRMVVYEGD